MRARVVLVAVSVGLVTLLGACSRGADGGTLGADASGDVQQSDGSSQDVSNTATSAAPDSLSDGTPQGTDGRTSDDLVPPDQFPNETVDTEGSKELPPAIPGYNFRELNPGDQVAQAQPALAGAEVTVRILDPKQRTGESYHPTILVLKMGNSPMAGQIAQVFSGGPWQGTEKTISGRNVWVNGDGANTELAWVKKSDTVVMLTGAPYGVLEPIMASIISLET